MTMVPRFSMTVILFSLALSSGAFSQWSSNTNTNNVVVKAAGYQRNQQITSDGAGGAFVAWSDTRREFYADVYLQHFNAAGYPQWAANGLLVSQGTISTENTMSIIEQHPALITDGSGGVIVAWEDERDSLDGPHSIYAQRIGPTGIIYWTANGIRISTEPHDKSGCNLIEDGSGGVLVFWTDARDGYYRPYAQRINSNGVAQWTGGDVALSTDIHEEDLGGVVSDDAGGAIVVWTDLRGELSAVYCQRIDPSGNLLWQPDGLPVSGNNFYLPSICKDGTGGAIIAWQYQLGGDIYAQRISGAGFLQWSAEAPPIASSFGLSPTIVATGAGNAVIAWIDYRNGFPDIYAQLVDPSGTPLWTDGGMPVDTVENNDNGAGSPVMTRDGAGGVVLAWLSFRNGGNNDILAQRFTAAGVALWKANGVFVSNAAGDQFNPVVCGDGEQGVIVAWMDSRNGVDVDIYAQKIDRNGEPGSANPTIVAVRDIANDQGGKVRLLWTASQLDVAPKTVIHSYSIKLGVKNTSVMGKKASQGPGTPDPIFWQEVVTQVADWSGAYSAVVPTVADSGLQGIPRYYFQVRAVSDSGRFWESNIDSGYSVDNIPPVGVGGASISALPNGTVVLQWNKDRIDPDLMGYSVHRSATPGFKPGPTTLLTLTTDSTYKDLLALANQDYYYLVVGVDVHGNSGLPSAELHKAAVISSVEEEVVPKEFALRRNYPNPFNPSTTIEFSLANDGRAVLKIYNVLGQELAVLFDQEGVAGRVYRAQFNASALTSGMYVAVLESGGLRLLQKMTLVK